MNELPECKVCGIPHDAETHGAVERIRAWLKEEISRRLTRKILKPGTKQSRPLR